jgi:V8-like Glu-specific endopeptidase
LVAPDVIATAAHCLAGENITALRFVFGYSMRDPVTPKLVIPNRDIYQARAVIAWQLDNKTGSDWALIRLDRPVTNHRIARIRQAGTIRNGQAVHAIGYPLGLPAKLAPGTVQSNTASSFFRSDIPSYPGNSGSPVFHSRTHAVEGLLTRGRGGEPVKQGACNVAHATGSVATRTSAFAHALSTLRSNP